ncbi:hypothetical protein DL1_20175 [Thioclava dalianensis]|uniref:Uncharacterized protein n=1 Tax=Thioclava dalianensis TaxID=1185766 RepID=A0A074TEF5_9RHOB|nr:hypothetical protein [Thioclava dalianensis]KEP70136.1 hypothetical protein DL1_20175 [Thioclava dalianensis]SFN51285.1 hypothetical protein SAMN05216224_106137 [Thioclava dalianensis]
MTVSKALKRAGAAGLVMSIALITTPSFAQQSGIFTLSSARLAARTASAKSVAGKGRARFDWLASAHRNTAKPRITQAHALGNGSYVCSPAGFGARSQCYKR